MRLNKELLNRERLIVTDYTARNDSANFVPITRAYWRQHWRIWSLPALILFAVLFSVRTLIYKPNLSIFCSVLLMQLLLSTPYNLKTQIGRAWWGGSVFFVAGAWAALTLPFRGGLWWFAALAGSVAYGVCCCLRWKPPIKPITTCES